MKPITIQDIRQAVSGTPLTPIPADMPPISAVCIDDRRIEKSSLFIAIKGERHDGHDHIAQAAAGGAIAALVEQMPAVVPAGMQLFRVANTRVAMGKLAKFVRQQMRAKVIAVAGSNGKTSTKQLIDAALRDRLKGSISPKSFNNDIGVPLTIFPADASQDYLVLEMGTNHPGEIANLSNMARPDIGVITNVGAEHLEGLVDLAGVRRENASLIEGLNPKGLLIVNGDDEELLAAVATYGGQRLTFGFKSSNDLFATDIECDDRGVRFSLNGSRRRVSLPLLGRHNACNALAAIAVGRKLGVPEDAVIESLSHAACAEMRMQMQPAGDVRILNDAYNANPSSMQAAIATFATLSAPGRRIAVLGDMRELGPSAERYHREIGQFAAEVGKPDWLVCVGAHASLIAEGAMEGGLPVESISHFPTAADAAAVVPMQVRAGDLLLIKASRGVHLEDVAYAIAQRHDAASAGRRQAAS